MHGALRLRHGYDAAALTHVPSECDELGRLIECGQAMNKIREVRGTARQYFGTDPHGFSADPERSYFLQEINGTRTAFESGL